MRAAVVGHVEWVRFARVERVPEPGEIVSALESWEEPAGGGAVAAAELVRLGAEVDFFVAVGNDELGEQAHDALEELGCRVHAARRDEPQRRAFTYLDSEGERTITWSGRSSIRTAPIHFPGTSSPTSTRSTSPRATQTRCGLRGRLASSSRRPASSRRSSEAHVAARCARRQRGRPSEAYEPGLLDPEPKLIVSTLGREGGSFVAGDEEGRFAAAAAPGADRRCLRCGRFLRGGPHLRARSWRRADASVALAFAAAVWRDGADDGARRARRDLP